MAGWRHLIEQRRLLAAAMARHERNIAPVRDWQAGMERTLTTSLSMSMDEYRELCRPLTPAAQDHAKQLPAHPSLPVPAPVATFTPPPQRVGEQIQAHDKRLWLAWLRL